MANYWHQFDGPAGTPVTVAPFTDVIGTSPVYVPTGWGTPGSASGASATGTTFNALRRVVNTSQVLASTVFFLPGIGNYGTADLILLRLYTAAAAGPALLLRNPASTESAPSAASPAIVLQNKGTGSYTDFATIYRFTQADRGQWYRLDLWSDTGGGGTTAGSARVRLYRRDSMTVLNGSTSGVYSGMNVANPGWQDARFGTFTNHLVSDMLVMENVADSATLAWTVSTSSETVWDSGTLGDPGAVFEHSYSATTTASNVVGEKSWAAPALSAESITLLTPPSGVPSALAGATLSSGGLLTLPSTVPAGSRVMVNWITGGTSQSNNASVYGNDVVPYPTSLAATVLVATDDAGMNLFPAIADNDDSTAVTFTSPATVVVELQPMTPRDSLDISVLVGNATGGSVQVAVTCAGETATQSMSPGAPPATVTLTGVPTEDLDWRKIPVTIAVT